MTPTATSPPDAPVGLSLVEVLGAILRYRRLVLGVAAAAAILMAGVVLARPRTFTATALFTPQAARSQMSGLGGLAAQLGVSVPATDLNQSPAFYGDLLRSRTVLEPLVHLPIRFTWKGKTFAGSFVQLAQTTGADSLLEAEAAINALRTAMSVSIAAKTGVVQVQTRTRYPHLSAILTDSALGRLNSFNVETRRSQAAAQRQFLEQRLRTISRELAEAEDALGSFAQRNRGDLRNSPELVIQQERLNRSVTLRTQVYGSLAQALEQAKLDEIRDTPLMTIIERAHIPIQPDPRGLLTTTILGFLAGLFLGSVIAVIRHSVRVSRAGHPESFAGLASEFAAARADLRRVFSPRSRRVKSSQTGIS